MQTECPHCHTVFRVAPAQLEMADGMVRCGFCKEVFNAKQGLDQNAHRREREPGEERLTGPTEQASDDGIQRLETPGGVISAALSFVSRRGDYSRIATAAWSIAILVLIFALLTEYLWFNQPEMFQHGKLKPLTTRLCQLVDCDRLQLRDPSQIEMISRNIYTHPNVDGALMINTTMVNHAAHAQPYPQVQIDFSDIRGKVVASRRFKPEEYLQIDTQELNLLQSGKPVTFGIEIQDPGREAITYEFSFH